MAYSVLLNLSVAFVTAGLALLAVSLRLRRRAQDYRRAMQEILQLGSKDLEPLEIPSFAWNSLASLGWRTLTWEGEWFGHTVRGSEGLPHLSESTNTGGALEFDILCSDEVHFKVKLFHHALRGESRLFAEQLARVFVVLLESRMRARTEALSVALARRASMSLYLQHDTRNLAQWVNWVCADFELCTSDDELLIFAKRLKENAPLARERATRLATSLAQSPVEDSPRQIDLHKAVTQAALLSGVEPLITGNAQAWVSDTLLSRALDNLFSNLAPNWRSSVSNPTRLQLRTVENDQARPMAELQFYNPWPDLSGHLPMEKLFEPFASGRPGGLGLGLYQERKCLREAGGELSATASNLGLTFSLRLPISEV